MKRKIIMGLFICTILVSIVGCNSQKKLEEGIKINNVQLTEKQQKDFDKKYTEEFSELYKTVQVSQEEIDAYKKTEGYKKPDYAYKINTGAETATYFFSKDDSIVKENHKVGDDVGYGKIEEISEVTAEQEDDIVSNFIKSNKITNEVLKEVTGSETKSN